MPTPSGLLRYAHDRVFHEKKLTVHYAMKVLSLSDGSAAYIIEGQPQSSDRVQATTGSTASSGFVTSLIVPQGNAADSIELAPAIGDSIKRTGVIAELVSTDDGYASAKGRKEVLSMGVKQISISGAKGKKLTSTPLRLTGRARRIGEPRRDRSAVESLDVSRLNPGFAFGELGRRGIECGRR